MTHVFRPVRYQRVQVVAVKRPVNAMVEIARRAITAKSSLPQNRRRGARRGGAR